MPAQKKQRQSQSGNEKKTTIADKLREGAYSALSQLKGDAIHVSQEIAAAIRSSEKEDGQIPARVSVDGLKRIQRVSAVEQLIKELADRETSRGQAHASTNGDVKQESGVIANGSAAPQNAGGNSGTVLTLFGNAPNPKQLFSSMQRPEETRDPKIKLELPVEEIGLPNGLTATQIMPSAADAKDGRTFEEAFPPPYALPSIHPPKGHKRSAVRDTTLNWEFKDPVSRGSKRGGYTTQSLTTADWLGYGGVDPAYGSSHSQEKRKQRDRALSGGESIQTVRTKAQAEAELEKQEEALFRRAFSSFAPSSDSAKSLVPSQTKAMMWYNKIGDRRFQEVFGDDPALVSDTPSADFALDPALMEPETKDEDFSAVIEQLDSLPDEQPAQAETDKTNPDEVLSNISELLETLASHQRIRNAIIPSTTSTSRTPISPAPTLASKIGKPDAPAEDEVNTYNKLRHEIAYLVMKLPPYAVAKLDGDQLADLGVSKLLPFEARDYQGALEEDEVAKIAKRTAAATAAATASLTRPTSSTTGQHYSSSSRTPAIGQAANTRYGQNATTASRTPATAPAYQRSVSGQNTNYGTPSAAPRPSYGQPNQYSRPGATQQPSYGQGNAQQQYYGGQARPAQGTANYGGYGQNYGQGTPQTQHRPSYSSSQPLQQFQQRSAQNAVAYQNNAVTQAQAATPFKRTGSPAMQPTYQGAAQQRPAYANAAAQPQAAQYGQQPASGRATPSYPSQPPTPVNGTARPQAPPGQRAASGTPQPMNPAQHQQQPVAQQSAQGMTNGHA